MDITSQFTKRGRKAIRTYTAPLTRNEQGNKKFLSLGRSACSQESGLPNVESSISLDELNRCSSELGSQPLSRTEVHSKYTVSQQLKEVMHSVVSPDSNCPSQSSHHRSLVRCWSRERIIRTEVILSIRVPNQPPLPMFGSSETFPRKSQITKQSSIGHVTEPLGSSHSLFSNTSVLGRFIPIKTGSTYFSDGSTGRSVESDHPTAPHDGFRCITQNDHPRSLGAIPLDHDLSVDVLTHDTDTQAPVTAPPDLEYSANFKAELSTLLKTGTTSESPVSLGSLEKLESDKSSPSAYSTANSDNLSSLSPTSSIDDEEDMSSNATADLAMWTQVASTQASSTEKDDSMMITFPATFRRDSTGYGIRVCGNRPVVVHSVRKGGTAENAGLRPGDQIIEVNGQSVEFVNHDDVVNLIKAKPAVSLLIRRHANDIEQQVVPSNIVPDAAKLSRQLTASEDPVLRGQSRRYSKKRRVSRDSLSHSTGTAAAIRRRLRTGGDRFDANQRSVQSCTDSTSDSPGPFTDEDFESAPETRDEASANSTCNPGSQADGVTTALPPLAPASFNSFHLRSASDRSPRSVTNRATCLGVPSDVLKTSSIQAPAAELDTSKSSIIDSTRIDDGSLTSPLVSSPTTDGDSFDSQPPVTFPTAQLSNSTTMRPPLLPSGLVMGRSFGDDSDDDLHIRDELFDLSARFENASAVLNSPARCGIFLNYLFNQNRDPSPALFCLISQYFRHALQDHRELLKDQKRVSTEILSTFFHEKSPLRLELPAPVVVCTLENVTSAIGPSTFAVAADSALNIVQTQVLRLGEEIRHGMDTWRPPKAVNILVSHSREEEIAIFELCLTHRLQALLTQFSGTIPSSSGDYVSEPPFVMAETPIAAEEIAQALYLCLLTAHRYFTSAGVGCSSHPDNFDSVSLCGSSPRNTLSTRSVENLTSTGIGSMLGSSGNVSSVGPSLWSKPTYFCMKGKQKPHGPFFGSRRPKFNVKNHGLQERAFERITECGVCGRLLWGISPQGLICSNCDLSVHLKCKSGIRDMCTKEGRKSGLFNIASVQGLAVNGVQSADNSQYRSGLPPLPFLEGHLNGGATGAIAALDSVVDNFASTTIATASISTVSSAPVSVAEVTSAGSGPVSSGVSRSNVAEAVPSDVSSEVDDSKSTQSSPVHIDQPNMEIGYTTSVKGRIERKESETKSPSSRSDTMASVNPTAVSLTVGTAKEFPIQMTQSAADLVPELVTTDWSNDPEMIASESFDAATELRCQFPEYRLPPKGSKDENYVRILCLLEFHQKTRFMVRHLKQCEYLLIQPWPKGKHDRLFHVLCLDRIPILIQLFRSLVCCIDKTKSPHGFVGMAEAVLSWLTDDSCANLKRWAQHCQALSCTNMLDCVNKWVRDYSQRHPDVSELLNKRHNKFTLVESLKQMRILYFNLPMIAKTIVKAMDQKTKSYRGEAKLWQQIDKHLASLPATIDDMCMPLVERINNGQLYSNLDKKDALFRQNNNTISPFRDLLLNFPHMLFRHWVMDHAEVAVDKLTVTSANKVNHDYIRERTEMLAILLREALILLVKDGDRFQLRAFKVTREHAGGTVPTPTGSERLSFITTSHLSSASFSGTPSSHRTYALSFSSPNASLPGTISNATPSPTIAAGGLVGAVASMAGSGISDRSSTSGTLKMAPILTLYNMYTSCGEKFRGEYLLNIISMDPTVLVRMLFRKEDHRKRWFTLLKEHSHTHFNRLSSLQQQKHDKRPVTSPIPSEAQPAEKGDKAEDDSISLEPGDEGGLATREPSSLINAESSDSVNSMIDTVSPVTLVHKSINECNRINQQLLRSVCNALHISEEEYDTMCENAKFDGVRNLNDLVLLQVNLTHNWLCYLSHSISLAFRGHEFVLCPDASPQPSAESINDLSGTSRRRTVLCLEDDYQRSTQQRIRSHASFDNESLIVRKSNLAVSTPNLVQLDETWKTEHRDNALVVQDSRALRNRVKRSSSEVLPKSPGGLVTDRLDQIERLATQIVLAVRQFRTLTSTSHHPDLSQRKFQENLYAEVADSGERPVAERVATLRPEHVRDRSDTLCPANSTVPTQCTVFETLEPNEPVKQVTDEQDESTDVLIQTGLPATSPDCHLVSEEILLTEPPMMGERSRDSGCLPSNSDDEEPDFSGNAMEDDADSAAAIAEFSEQLTPTTRPNGLDLLPHCAPVDLNSSESPPDLRTGLPADDDLSQLLSTLDPPATVTQILVNRNDSQKSTTSSGFVEF